MTQEQATTESNVEIQESIHVIRDTKGLFQFMDPHKPMLHLRKLKRGFRMKALIKIKKGMKHTSTLEIKTDNNDYRYIVLNVNKDPSVKEPYVIALQAFFKDKGGTRLPAIGIKVIGGGTPEEGRTMIGEHDADDRP